jgi:hypothetical protein
LRQELIHEVKSSDGKCSRRCRMEAFGDTEQLAIEVVDAPPPIIGLSGRAERILPVVEGQSHLGASRETAGDTDCADGIQSVGILQDPRLGRRRRDPP